MSSNEAAYDLLEQMRQEWRGRFYWEIIDYGNLGWTVNICDNEGLGLGPAFVSADSPSLPRAIAAASVQFRDKLKRVALTET